MLGALRCVLPCRLHTQAPPSPLAAASAGAFAATGTGANAGALGVSHGFAGVDWAATGLAPGAASSPAGLATAASPPPTFVMQKQSLENDRIR